MQSGATGENLPDESNEEAKEEIAVNVLGVLSTGKVLIDLGKSVSMAGA